MIDKTYDKIKAKIKHHFSEVLKTKRSPHAIAIGFAVGTLINILPTPGLNIPITIMIILIFERINKYSLLSALAFWNPFTLPFVYVLDYKVGNLLFNLTNLTQQNLSAFGQIFQYASKFITGSLIVATIFSILSYFIVKYSIIYLKYVRKNKLKRKAL